MQYLENPKTLRNQAPKRKLTKKYPKYISNERRLYIKALRLGRSVRRLVRAVLVLLACWYAVSFSRDPSAILRVQAICNRTALVMPSTLKVQSEKVNWTALEERIQEFQRSTTMAWDALLELTSSVWTPENTFPEACLETNNVNAYPFEESQQELSQPTFWQHIVSGSAGPAEAFTCASDAGYAGSRNLAETIASINANASTCIPASAQENSRTLMSSDTKPPMSSDTEPAPMEPITLQGDPGTQFGRSIALSADGSILAAGAPFSNEFGSEAGRVGLYQLVGNSAKRLFIFSGNKVGLRVGQSVSISRSSPAVLALSGTDFVNVYPVDQFLNVRGGFDPRVLKFERFEADFINEDYGAAISISGDGTRLAVGSPRTSNASQQHVGMVQIYLVGTGKLGLEIPGLDENDFFGSAVSLSEDGATVAAGSFTGASGAGYVRIFRQNGHNWDQVGQTIQGQQPGDNLGRSISISADGRTVATGAFQAEAGTGLGVGYVQVYQFDGTAWVQVGKDIVGPNNGDRFGVSVALTPDASFLSIGANAHDSFGFTKNGLVQVYENQNGTWMKVGGDIVGNADSRNLGVGLAISSDGRTLAAGGPFSTAAQNANVGEAGVYPIDTTSTCNLTETAIAIDTGVYPIDTTSTCNLTETATPRDTPAETESIYTERITLQGSSDAQFGSSIALSADGSICAVGAPFYNKLASEGGWVSLYQLAGNSANYLFEFSGDQVGLRVGQSLSMSRSSPPILAIGGVDFVDVYSMNQFLNGPEPQDLQFDRFVADFLDDDFGSAISISGDGTRLAIGAPRAAIDSPNMGMVQIYVIGTGQIGPEILGIDENDLFGSAVSLSEDGATVAAGALTGASGAGYVRIFRQSGHNWDQIGQTIQGQQPGDNLGRSISISADGQTVAIGAFQAEAGTGAGYVQVYQFDGTAWIQVGMDIVGPTNGDRFGVSVALTPDASFLSIGANAHDSGGFTKNGLVQVYESQSGTWTKIGGDIVGNADSRNLGVGLAISSDGRTLLAGGPLRTSTQDTHVGEAVLYDL